MIMPEFGFKHSSITKRKMSISQTGRTPSKTTREKQRMNNIGKHSSRVDKAEQKIRDRFSHGKADAKEGKRTWRITLDEYKELLHQNCHYCNKELLPATGVNLDRIDSSKGYTLDNVLPCCGDCNIIRNTKLTVREMEVAMQAVMRLRLCGM